MPIIELTRGLPASGKSTYARDKVSKHGNWKIVCRDDLRAMLDDGTWSSKREKTVVNMQKLLATELVKSNFNVIIADTNLNPKIVSMWTDLAHELGARVRIKEFNVPLEECIKRDLQRTNSVGKDVIVGMYNKYLAEKPKLVLDIPECDNKLKAVIVDIDGTVAYNGSGRSPFDWHRVGEDSPVHPIIKLVYLFYDMGYEIIFLSGRDEVCRNETFNWLDRYFKHSWKLFMRPVGNTEKDVVIKRRLYEEEVKPFYTVEYVIDDRLQVCRMWHELGLTLLRVGDPDADF